MDGATGTVTFEQVVKGVGDITATAVHRQVRGFINHQHAGVFVEPAHIGIDWGINAHGVIPQDQGCHLRLAVSRLRRRDRANRR